MESNFNNRDFERFLKQNADQYRMFPSENVWKGIHGTLHTRRRWYGIALALLLLTTGTVTWVMLTGPSARKNQVTINKPVTAKAVQKEQPVVITPLKVKAINSQVLIASPDNHQKNLFLANQVVEKNTIDVAELHRSNAVVTVPSTPVSQTRAIAFSPAPISRPTASFNKEL
jgi:hypothetical protein